MRSSAHRNRSKVWGGPDGAPDQALAQTHGAARNAYSSPIRTPQQLTFDLRTRHAIIARRAYDEYTPGTRPMRCRTAPEVRTLIGQA